MAYSKKNGAVTQRSTGSRGYDAQLDKVLFEEVADCGMFNIVVSVYSYNGGEMKLQLSRQKLQEGKDAMWQKLGRLSLGELDEVMPHIAHAIGVMRQKQDVDEGGNKSDSDTSSVSSGDSDDEADIE